MLKDFRDFAVRGNVVDLAVGVIIGAAFTGVVNSLVADVLMPPIGRLTGNVDFKDLFVSLNGQHYASLATAKAAGAPTLNYGVFLNSVVNFLIVSFVIFMLVRQLARFQRVAAVTGAAPSSKKCPYCRSAIAFDASRCPQCTSHLSGDESPAAS